MVYPAGNNSSYERAYKYSYDGINRYTGSAYSERTPTGTGAFNNNTGGFDESGITYDLNGNILALQRNSSTQGTNTHIQIDNLTYAYDATNPNQLKTVTDGTGANYTSAGFRNYTGSTGSYAYDTNGNLTADPYKGLTLAYDVLNRTDKITVTTSTGRYINYTYDASGSLIEKQQYDNNLIQTTTDYVDGFVYVNKTLSYFPMPEGRVVNSGGTLDQEFIITDQQGNARLSFNNSGTDGTPKVIQENSYYGYGFTLLNSPVALPTTPNKQLYNGGSEWQNDYSNLPDYYQTFNRNYDAATARFIGVDPAAESAESLTSYQYAGNNPIMYNDPLGDLKHQDLPPLPLYGNGGYLGRANDLVGGTGDTSTPDGFTQQMFNQTFGTLGFGGIPVFQYSVGPDGPSGNSHTVLVNGIPTNFANGTPLSTIIVNAVFNSIDDTYTNSRMLPEVSISDLRSGNYPSWWGQAANKSANQGGLPFIYGNYDSRLIAVDRLFNNASVKGAFVGNVSNLGFTAHYQDLEGNWHTMNAIIPDANFTIPRYGEIQSKEDASNLFKVAYNLAVSEIFTDIWTSAQEGKILNGPGIKQQFIGLINSNLNIPLVSQPGSSFNGNFNALGSFPSTQARYTP